MRMVQDTEKVCIMTIRKLVVADKIHTSPLTFHDPLTKIWVTRSIIKGHRHKLEYFENGTRYRKSLPYDYWQNEARQTSHA